jgi:glycosyltransferase involved in cell wall biosynthesis
MTPNRAESARILFMAPQPLHEDRGTPIAVRQVLEALSELGHEVDLLTYPQGTEFALPGLRWFRSGNPLRIAHVPVGFSLRKVALDISLARRLRRLVAEERYDWIHAVEEAAFLAVWIARARGIPVLYDMQSSIPQQLATHPVLGLGPVHRFIRRSEARLLQRADLVVASEGLAGYVTPIAPDCRCREWNFPAGIHFADARTVAEVRSGLDLRPGTKTVVYTGTFEDYQGLPLLIEGAPAVLAERPETVFVLVGGMPARAADLRRVVARAGLLEHFRIVQRQTRDRAQAYVEIADVTVSPRAFGDNLPLKIYDYMAAGKPTVATAIPAHTATIDPGLLVLAEPRPAAFAESILSLLRDPARARELGTAAQEYARAQFGWRAFVDAIGSHSQEVRRPRGHVVAEASSAARPAENH